MTPKQRNMTTIFLESNGQILLLYREGGRVVNHVTVSVTSFVTTTSRATSTTFVTVTAAGAVTSAPSRPHPRTSDRRQRTKATAPNLNSKFPILNS